MTLAEVFRGWNGQAQPPRNVQPAASEGDAFPNVASLMHTLGRQIFSAYKWMEKRGIQQLANRRLRVTETVSVGEKRTVSILKIDGTEILIGCASGQISMLAVLDADKGLWRKEVHLAEHTS